MCSAQHWFRLHAVVGGAVPEAADQKEKFFVSLFETLEQYVQSSTWGEFETRIAMLRSFYWQLVAEIDAGVYTSEVEWYAGGVVKCMSTFFFAIITLRMANVCLCTCSGNRTRIAHMLFNFVHCYQELIPRYVVVCAWLCMCICMCVVFSTGMFAH